MKKKFSLTLLLILMSTSSWGAQIGNYPLKSAVSNNDTAVIVDAADANKLKRTPFVASNIPVLDTTNYYLGADVEAALAEIGADLDAAVVLNFDANEFSVVEGNVTIKPGVYEPADPTILKVAEIDTQAEFESLLFPFPSGGTGAITEVSTLPTTLVDGTVYAAIDTQTWTFKSATGKHVLAGWTYTADDSDPPASSVLFDMDFEGTQAEDLAGGWTITQPAGSLTLDGVATPMSGLQYMYANNGGPSNGINSPTITPEISDVYYRFLWRASSTASTTQHGIVFRNSLGIETGVTKIATGYRITHGTASALALATIETGTMYYNCGRFTVGASGSGVHKLNVGTSPDPTLNLTTALTTGTSTDPISSISLMQYGAIAMYLDDFVLSSAPITECVGAGL